MAEGRVVNENSVYVTVDPTAPGLKPADRVAVSVTDDPTVMVAEGVITVAMEGLALLTVRGSQLLVAALLLASPLNVAENPYEPAGVGVNAAEFGTLPAVVIVTV